MRIFCKSKNNSNPNADYFNLLKKGKRSKLSKSLVGKEGLNNCHRWFKKYWLKLFDPLTLKGGLLTMIFSFVK